MIAFKDVGHILKTSLSWENKLKDFYDVAELALKNAESKQVVAALRKNLLEKLEILENIDLKKFGKTAWVRYAPDYKEGELIPVGKINRDSNPQEIFTHILAYGEKLKNFYAQIAGNLITRDQKELFASLALFKDEQIKEIKRFMEQDYLVS